MFVNVCGFEMKALGKVSGFSPCSCNVVCASDVKTRALYVFVCFKNSLDDWWIQLWLPCADVGNFL